MKKIYIFGHKNPDTDSVTSAITLSYLKNSLGFNAEPRVLGKLNNETKFVLNYFKIKEPRYLEDVKLQIRDLNYYKDYYLPETSSIKKTYDYLIEKDITGIPIVDSNKKLKGITTLKDIAKKIIDVNYNTLNTSYNNILETLDGEEILKFDDEINGNLLVATFKSTTFLNQIELTNNDILIVGDRHSILEYAVKSKVKMIILVGNNTIKPNMLKIAKKNKINIISTSYDSFHTAKLVILSDYIKNILSSNRSYRFTETDYYDEFISLATKLKYNNYPIVGKNDTCKGLIRITDTLKKNKKKVILVDHNEYEQSVDGIEEAEIIEVIDHHRIGNISTNNPINFRNMSVGSTNTIVYNLYLENKVDITYEMAGLMISGILSDTLGLTSPTTTKKDIEAVLSLSNILKVDYNEYFMEMMREGTSLKGLSIIDILNQDMKAYEVNNKTYCICQVTTLDHDYILNNKEEYLKEIENIKNYNKYDAVLFLITNIVDNGSYLLYSKDSEEYIKVIFNTNTVKQGIFLKKIVSRKKQVVSKLGEI